MISSLRSNEFGPTAECVKDEMDDNGRQTYQSKTWREFGRASICAKRLECDPACRRFFMARSLAAPEEREQAPAQSKRWRELARAS
jgi:hypothetical protein